MEELSCHRRGSIIGKCVSLKTKERKKPSCSDMGSPALPSSVLALLHDFSRTRPESELKFKETLGFVIPVDHFHTLQGRTQDTVHCGHKGLSIAPPTPPSLPGSWLQGGWPAAKLPLLSPSVGLSRASVLEGKACWEDCACRGLAYTDTADSGILPSALSPAPC